MRISRSIVTGGAGFIGSNLVDHLVKIGHKVIVIDNFVSGKKANLSHHKKSDVKVIKLDRFCELKKIKKIDLIKIDVEGYEYMVLQGAKRVIHNIHYIMIEVQKNRMYKNYSSYKIEKYLKKNNFVLLKKFNFPFMFFQDRLYKNKKFN